MREKYGIPYMGSKSQQMKYLAQFFPKAENFYDVFGGGFAVTHYMLKHRADDYQNFYFNEIKLEIVEFIKDVLNGKYDLATFKPEWVSKEKFDKEKLINGYIQCIWSFSNDPRRYIYGKSKEDLAKSIHNAVVFDEFDNLFKKEFGFDKWPDRLNTINSKRLYLNKTKNTNNTQKRIIQIERLNRANLLKNIEESILQKLTFSSFDYRELQIKPNSVIYCDPPYNGSRGYDKQQKSLFNNQEFLNWAANQHNPLFITEKNIEDNRFYEIGKFNKHNHTGLSKNTTVFNKLYCNQIAYDILQRKNLLHKK